MKTLSKKQRAQRVLDAIRDGHIYLACPKMQGEECNGCAPADIAWEFIKEAMAEIASERKPGRRTVK